LNEFNQVHDPTKITSDLTTHKYGIIDHFLIPRSVEAGGLDFEPNNFFNRTNLESIMFLRTSILGLLCIALTTSSLEAQDFRTLGTRRGAITGAVIGGLIGGKNDEVAAGIIAGGLIGGVTGRAIGNRMDANSYGYQQSYGHQNYGRSYAQPAYNHYGHYGQQQNFGRAQTIVQPQPQIQYSNGYGDRGFNNGANYGYGQGGYNNQGNYQSYGQGNQGYSSHGFGGHSVLQRGW
jgi:hypothetical protein